jgi:hypothetical protein
MALARRAADATTCSFTPPSAPPMCHSIPTASASTTKAVIPSGCSRVRANSASTGVPNAATVVKGSSTVATPGIRLDRPLRAGVP